MLTEAGRDLGGPGGVGVVDLSDDVVELGGGGGHGDDREVLQDER